MLKYWEDEAAVAPSQSLVSLTRAVRASASSAPQAPVNATVEVGFKKDRHKPPAPPKRKKRPQAELMDVLRGNRSCLLALGLDETAQDIMIIQALLRVEEPESFFRNHGAAEDVAKNIAALYEACGDELLNISNGFLFKAWCLAVELLLAIMAIFVLAAVVVWLSTLDWVKGECLFSDFTNGTCHHGNDCRLQIATQTDQGIAYVNNFVVPVTSGRDSNANGLKIFDGAFRCCNYAQAALYQDAIPEEATVESIGSLGQGFGSGTPCCNFYNSRFKVFCDNFGIVEQFSHCPTSPWACRLFSTVDERGRPQISEVQVWEEPWTWVLVLCAVGMLVPIATVIAVGFACKHSELLYRVGLRFTFAVERLQRRVRLGARLRECSLRTQACCRRALRLSTKAQDRALRRERKMRELLEQIEERLKAEEEAELAGASEEEIKFGGLKRGKIQEMKDKAAAKAAARKRVAAHELRKMFRKSRKKKSASLQILENDGKPELLRISQTESAVASSSEDSADNQVHPWDSEMLEEVQESGEDQTHDSRPATKNLQSMLRPIMTPMEPRRSPRVSRKFGLQDFSSTTGSFATATSFHSGFGTDLGSTSLSSVGRGDSMAQTFSEGFHYAGVQGVRRKKKRRVQDGKMRRGKARAAWQSDPEEKTFGRQTDESFNTSKRSAWNPS